MLLRDGADGVETLLLERRASGDFGGAWVFPGGLVEPSDTSARMQARVDGLAAAEANARLSVAADGLAYWIAAIRECFEESGVLIARRADGVSGWPEAAELGNWRRRVDGGEASFVEFCEAAGLVPDVRALTYASHWTTPAHFPRRYSTRFFVAHAPAGARGRADGRETVASSWVRPTDVLERFTGDRRRLPLPTAENLKVLAGHASVDDAIASFAAQPALRIPEITPARTQTRDGVRLTLTTRYPDTDG